MDSTDALPTWDMLLDTVIQVGASYLAARWDAFRALLSGKRDYVKVLLVVALVVVLGLGVYFIRTALNFIVGGDTSLTAWNYVLRGIVIALVYRLAKRTPSTPSSVDEV